MKANEGFEDYVMSLDKFKNRQSFYVLQLDENGRYENPDVYALHHAWAASSRVPGTIQVPLSVLAEMKKIAEGMMSSAHHYQDECHMKSFARQFLHVLGEVPNESE